MSMSMSMGMLQKTGSTPGILVKEQASPTICPFFGTARKTSCTEGISRVKHTILTWKVNHIRNGSLQVKVREIFF
jgi:hypothetical protein